MLRNGYYKLPNYQKLVTLAKLNPITKLKSTVVLITAFASA